jgi:hypothetical protein
MGTAKGLVARRDIITALWTLLDEGVTVLLYGPVGVGKTSLIRALRERASSRRVPCGVSARTETLQDLTNALSLAYPSVDARSGTQRQIRARLRNAVEEHPGLLLLDHVGATGTAFKGALRAMRGMGLGVLLAGDVDHPRDHARLRALRLAQREVELPRLHGSAIHGVLMAAASEVAGFPFDLKDNDIRALALASEGLPGRAVSFVEALRDPGSWRSGHPRFDWLRTEAVIGAAERYRRPIP